MTPFEMLLFVLAGQRLLFLWLKQEVFAEAREGLGRLHPKINYFINCPVCTSIWASAAMLVLWELSWLGRVLVSVLAISMSIATFNAIMQRIER